MSYSSKRKPREKQIEALDRMRGKESFALLMAMRTGKTKVIVDDWGEMVADGRSADMIVVAPAGAYLTWVDAIPLDLPDDILRRTWTYTWVSGKTKSKSSRREMESFLSFDGPRILIVNVEAISQVKSARDFIVKFMEKRPALTYAAIDESVTIKNLDAACTKFCLDFLAPLSSHRRILSGLVSPRSPLDLFSQFKFLDPKILGHDKFTTFRARYAKVKNVCMLPTPVIHEKFKGLLGIDQIEVLSEDVLRSRISSVIPDVNLNGVKKGQLVETMKMMLDGTSRDRMIDGILALGGYVQTIPIIDGYENVEELHQKISPHSFRVRLEDCYDMPPSDYSFRDVEMTPEQRRIYDQVREFATAELENGQHVTVNHVIVQILRLHQILCGHTKDEEGGWHTIPERRTKALIDLLSDYDGKAVIWASYDGDVRKIFESLEKEFGDGSTSRFWGGNIKTREEEELAFKSDPSRRFMIGTPDAGGRARTWDVADLVVYYSSKNNLDHRAQSEERAKNDGKTRPVSYVDLRVPGTVDEKIVRALREKINMASVINGDNWREWLI